MTTANPLGRIENHDPRSRRYPYRSQSHSRYFNGIASVRHSLRTPNLDQFYTSGCVGFSGANILNCAKAQRSRRRMNDWMEQQIHNKYLDHEAGIENYHQSTVFDPFPWTYPPADEGSSALGLMKFWKRYDVIKEYRWAFTFEELLAALMRQPVLVGTMWYESMNTPDKNGFIDELSGQNYGGHQYVANAVLADRGWIGFENSWGEQWGARGKFYLTFENVRRLLAENGDVAIPIFH